MRKYGKKKSGNNQSRINTPNKRETMDSEKQQENQGRMWIPKAVSTNQEENARENVNNRLQAAENFAWLYIGKHSPETTEEPMLEYGI